MRIWSAICARRAHAAAFRIGMSAFNVNVTWF